MSDDRQAEARAELARRDPNFWVETAWKDKYGKKLKQGTIHREIQNFITAHPDGMIESSRGHGKTSQMIARSVWELGNNRDLGITLVCANDTKAKKRLGEIRTNIERNPDVQRVFPGLSIDPNNNNKSQILLNRSGIAKDFSVEAYGVLSSGTGDRSDWLIFDDVCDRRNTLSQPGMRKQVIEAYGDWMNILGPKGRSTYIYTPWHNEDLSHVLKRRGNLPLLKRLVKAEWTSAGEPRRFDPIWPEKWDSKALRIRWEKIQTRAFKRDFCGEAVDDSERTIWPDWFEFGPPPFPLSSATRVQIWDGAAPRKTKGKQDYMAYIDMYVSALAGKVFFADAWRARGLGPNQQVNAVKSRLHLGPWPEYLIIEQIGESALASLVAEAGILPERRVKVGKNQERIERTRLVPIGAEGKRKEVRAAEYLAPLMEGRHVVWAEKLNPEENEDALPVMTELVDMPFGDHDDLADCAVYGARVAKRLVRFGTQVKSDVPIVTAAVELY